MIDQMSGTLGILRDLQHSTKENQVEGICHYSDPFLDLAAVYPRMEPAHQFETMNFHGIVH
jgi:hypothetical protein